MLLDFDIRKAIAASSFILQRQGGRDSMFFLVKKLYYADRTALICWGNSITGDELSSLPSGPIVSHIYDLMKGSGSALNLKLWDAAIKREGNTISLKSGSLEGPLSEREKEVLEKSRETINNIRGIKVSTWFHDNCPEWTDPGHSSSPIDPSQILRIAHKTEEEIRKLEHANEELRLLNCLLGSAH
ncbi:MAG TPA: Panacea domain-containing protein [Candidatus Sulfotelmatobacter sp.]|jgi:hypothetical protein